MIKRVKSKVDFIKIEHKILDFWNTNSTFEKSIFSGISPTFVKKTYKVSSITKTDECLIFPSKRVFISLKLSIESTSS